MARVQGAAWPSCRIRVNPMFSAALPVPRLKTKPPSLGGRLGHILRYWETGKTCEKVLLLFFVKVLKQGESLTNEKR